MSGTCIRFSIYIIDYCTSTGTANRYVPAPIHTSFPPKAFVAANTESEFLYRRGDYTVWSFEDIRLADEVPEYRAKMTRRKKIRLEEKNKTKLEAKNSCPGDE